MTGLSPKKIHLFTPGPTSVPDTVLREMSAPIMHHRTAQWQEAFGKVLDGLKRVFGTEHDVATFASSGSGAMESAVMNLVTPGDEVCVAAHGRFGKRWAQLAERAGATVHLHETERGERPDPDAVGAFVAAHPNAKVAFLTHSETSTGAVSDAKALADSIRAQAGEDVLLVLDAISSLGATRVETDAWGYDAIVAGSQKALMVPPGMAFAAISPRALERARATTAQRWYFDWPKAVDAHRKSPPSTPVTPAITIVLGLGVALDMMFEEGLDNVYERHIRLGRATRAAVDALGFELFSPDHDSSVALTAVRVPEGADWGTKITGALKDYGVTIAGGQDDLKGKMFRLGHCGWVNELDLVLMIAALERGLLECGVDIEPGAGVAAAQRSLLSGKVGANA
jgi:aspartate aminotransferase-like enzyme